jgi:hypothetical protein
MRITINDIQTSLNMNQTYDIANAIHNSASGLFQQYVPLANADNVNAYGAGILVNQAVQNEFITNLVDRIGLVVVRKIHLSNPLKKFKKGKMPYGRTIEEIFTDITQGQKYDPYDAENTLFKRTIPNVKTLYHERNRQDRYDATIMDEALKTAFTSWNAFGDFVSGIVNALYNSAEVEEYKYMRMLIDNYYSRGYFTVIPVSPVVDATSAKAFIKKVRATVTKMTLPMGSRDWNSLAVHTVSDPRDLHLFISADLEAEVDVDVLASAFNLDKTTFLANRTVIDGFASIGLDAVLVDKSFFQVYDNELKLETVRNSKGLYWNTFYHVWQTLSVSRFANAVAFAESGVPAVTNVVVSPSIASLKAGATFAFAGYVRATDGNTHALTWSVAASTASTTLQAGTTIDANGNLTVASNQTGELLVTAKSVGTGVDIDGAGPDTTDVIGTSIVTIVPSY